MQLSLTYKNQNELRPIEPFISKGYKGMYDVYYTDIKTGKRTKKTTRTSKQNEAIKELDRFKKKYYNNVDEVKIKRISELNSFIQNFRKTDLSSKTLELYNTSFKNFISAVGDKELRFVLFLDIEKFKAILSEKRSKNTVNIYLRTLKSAFNYAKELGAIYENPAKPVKLFRIPEKPRLCFEIEDIPRLINSLEIPYLQRIAKFALESVARIGEILNLQWSDSDITRDTITFSNKNDFLTKTRRERTIPLSKNMKRIINENPYLSDKNVTIQPSLFEQSSNVFELNFKRNVNYVFGKVDGTKYSTGYISKLFKRKIRIAGFEEKYHFHCLRHTALTNMGNSNFPLFFMKEIAGHKNVKTTEGYVHPSLNDMRNYMDSVNYSGVEYDSLGSYPNLK